MAIIKNLFLTMFCSFVLLGCAPAGQSAVARLGDNPIVTGGVYSSGGGLSVAVDLREEQGRTLVCGVWAQSKQQSILTKGKAKDIIDTGSIFLGRERVVQNFLFMKEVEPAETYAGQEAGCLLLDRPWMDADAQRTLLLRIPRQVVEIQDDESGGLVVTFTDTGRPEAGP
ncbi:MAG: hypothetical protein AAFO72_13690 [Pseudomonadota bacterium]